MQEVSHSAQPIDVVERRSNKDWSLALGRGLVCHGECCSLGPYAIEQLRVEKGLAANEG